MYPLFASILGLWEMMQNQVLCIGKNRDLNDIQQIKTVLSSWEGRQNLKQRISFIYSLFKQSEKLEENISIY